MAKCLYMSFVCIFVSFAFYDVLWFSLSMIVVAMVLETIAETLYEKLKYRIEELERKVQTNGNSVEK